MLWGMLAALGITIGLFALWPFLFIGGFVLIVYCLYWFFTNYGLLTLYIILGVTAGTVLLVVLINLILRFFPAERIEKFEIEDEKPVKHTDNKSLAMMHYLNIQ